VLISDIENLVDKYPIDLCKFKILPELLKSVEFVGAGYKALITVFKIGSRLDQKEFNDILAPSVIKLFSSPDRSLKLMLCEKIDVYINNFSDQSVNDNIFPNLVLI
jgi:SCY1-like protein 1